MTVDISEDMDIQVRGIIILTQVFDEAVEI
jgi:hypothetical protein